MSRRIKNGLRTEQWKIDAMRKMWLQGDSLTCIATAFAVSTHTVNRHCSDLERPKQIKPLSNPSRQILLNQWRPI